MLSPTSSLSVSYIVIYPFIAIPAIFSLIRHGKYGILGWGYLIAFCIMRLTGAGLQLANPSSSTASILIGVGLSPLILAALGILHESCVNFTLCPYHVGGTHSCHRSHFIAGGRPWPLKTALYILLHLAVGVAVALVASGSKSSSGSTSGKSRVGAFLFLLIWFIIAAICYLSLSYPKVNNAARLVSRSMLSKR